MAYSVISENTVNRADGSVFLIQELSGTHLRYRAFGRDPSGRSFSGAKALSLSDSLSEIYRAIEGAV